MIKLINESSNQLSLGKTLIKYTRIFPDYTLNNVLYHNTKQDNVYSIFTNGILVNRGKYIDYEGEGIWCTNTSNQQGYGGYTVCFNSDSYTDSIEKVNDDEFRIYRDINPKDILFIDFPIINGHRISDVPRLMKEYGIQHTLDVLSKTCYTYDVTIEEIKQFLTKFGVI